MAWVCAGSRLAPYEARMLGSAGGGARLGGPTLERERSGRWLYPRTTRYYYGTACIRFYGVNAVVQVCKLRLEALKLNVTKQLEHNLQHTET